MTRSPQKSSYASVSDFHETLSIAIEDAQLENSGMESIHFFDTDIVYGALDPLADLKEHIPGSNNKRTYDHLMRALWMSGSLGHTHMVWPHILEFRRKVQGGNLSPSDRDKNLKEFMQERDPGSFLKPLTEVAESESDDQSESALQYIEAAADVPANVYSLLEATVGTFRQRWKQLAMLIRESEYPGLKVPDLTQDPRLWSCVTVIAAARDEIENNRLTIRDNTLTDALAVLSLDNFQRKGLTVRFCSFTSELIQAMRSQAMQRALNGEEFTPSMRIDLTEAAKPTSIVARDSYYYMFRIMFQSLWHTPIDEKAHSGAADSGASHLSLESLISIRDSIGDILRGWDPESSNDQSLIEALKDVDPNKNSELAISGYNIPRLVEELEAHSIASRIWVDKYTLALQRLVERFSNAERLVSFQSEHEVFLTTNAADKTKAIKHDLNNWDRVTKAIARVQSHVIELRSMIEVDGHERPYEDLGMTRWSVLLGSQGPVSAQTVLNGVLFEEGKAYSQHIAKTAWAMSATPWDTVDRRSLDDFRLGTLFALGLRLYDQITEGYTKLEASAADNLPIDIEILSIVVNRLATKHGRRRFAMNRIRKLVTDKRINDVNRGDVLHSLAWASYLYWCDHWIDENHKSEMHASAKLTQTLADDAASLFEGVDEWKHLYASLLSIIAHASLARDHDDAANVLESIQNLPQPYIHRHFVMHCISVSLHTLVTSDLLTNNEAQDARIYIQSYKDSTTNFWNQLQEAWVSNQSHVMFSFLKRR